LQGDDCFVHHTRVSTGLIIFHIPFFHPQVADFSLMLSVVNSTCTPSLFNTGLWRVAVAAFSLAPSRTPLGLHHCHMKAPRPLHRLASFVTSNLGDPIFYSFFSFLTPVCDITIRLQCERGSLGYHGTTTFSGNNCDPSASLDSSTSRSVIDPFPSSSHGQLFYLFQVFFHLRMGIIHLATW